MNPHSFLQRHLGPNENEQAIMLNHIGVSSIEKLIEETIPSEIRLKSKLDLDSPMTEHAFLDFMSELADKNSCKKTYIGLGYHAAVTPAVIQRNILENPGWYTAYTPYQAEIAQGRLEALLNYQTVVCEITAMEIANASLLDESTAAAEAMSLVYNLRNRNQKEANCFFVDENTLPQTISLLKTRSEPLGIELLIGNPAQFDFNSRCFGALLQYPNAFGEVNNYAPFVKQAQEQEIKTVVAADLLSLALLEAPGSWGADVVVGTSQRFGIPLGYGGPHAAYFATKEAYKRHIPGRIIGVTKGRRGELAYRMALQTREQHIKRDRATSNICTSQVLLAVMAGMYAVYHGPKGLQHIASSIHSKANHLASVLEKMGVKQHNKVFFDTLLFEAPANKIKDIAEKSELNFWYPSQNTVSIALNETTTETDLTNIIHVFASALGCSIPKSISFKESSSISNDLTRKSPYLTQEVFNKYHSETALMRYMKRLERKDLALNQSMISLGSCTMKLNAAAEMLPLSWPKWNSLHPFVPIEQATGYHQMMEALKSQLNKITGFAGTSLQPNSGAQGEYSGLMVIRAYHHANGDQHRNICLIPSSAHGTNPASAVMAGMKVVVVGTDKFGNINEDELKEKAIEYADNLAALMVTYPSTHGVFESSIKRITAAVHASGGLVYMDGANMNAQVGLTNPALIGADVCHLNLHKTFAIPHGGGGPGVGPICVAEHLVPFLPGNPVVETGGSQAITAISAAPWGSAMACLISYGYIKMLGAEGLTAATQIAILNANYIKSKLEQHYQILYIGEQGRTAHELIIDCRDFKSKGIEVTDIAKRLMDYGFHAPTVSFPVPGTIMIEPTESENLAEIDRFCDAMIHIRFEIEASDASQEQNILRNAPHTLEVISADEWEMPYARSEAAYPLSFVKENKFWPSVSRVDEAFGDRNLICTCAPVESYVELE